MLKLLTSATVPLVCLSGVLLLCFVGLLHYCLVNCKIVKLMKGICLLQIQ